MKGEKLDITRFFEEDIFKLLEFGFDYSHKTRKDHLTAAATLFHLIDHPKIENLLGKDKLEKDQLKVKLGQLVSQEETEEYVAKVYMSSQLIALLLVAFEYIRQKRKKTLGLEDLLLSFATHPDFEPYFKDYDLEAIKPNIAAAQTKTGVSKTPILDKYTDDLTSYYRSKGEHEIIDRDAELSQVIRILSRQTRNNVLLVGDTGVGKRTIVEQLSSRIAYAKVPSTMRHIRILELLSSDVSSLAANPDRVVFWGDEVRQELQDSDGILVFIENLQDYFGENTTRELYIIGKMIRQLLMGNEIRIVANIDPETFRKDIESDQSLQKMFDVVKVEEPNEEIAVEMVKIASKQLATFHGVEFSGDAVRTAVYFSKRYLADKKLPEKAVDLLDESASKVTLDEGQMVTEEDVTVVISEKTGIPISKITQTEQSKLVNLEKIISESVLGQDHAVKIVSEAIRRSRAGLKDPKKPLGSFMFLGPTGVGKTELAKVLTKQVYDDIEAMIRIDMSEFSEQHTVQRLIGAPPGYVGYDEGGQLTNPVYEKPYSLILLDEIEKAHPKVFDVFLQVLDDGRLTDGKGRTVDFKNTIIIATSNIASNEITEMMKGQERNKDAREVLTPVLMEYFRPEFINRFDAVIAFNPLSLEVMQKITDLNVKKLVNKLKDQGVEAVYSPNFVTKVAQDSYDPKMGARPLLRYLQENIENKIAKSLIDGSLKQGETLNLDSLLFYNETPDGTGPTE